MLAGKYVTKILYLSIRSVYVTIIFLMDVTHTRWEIRDSKILLVYKIAVRDCNFYLNVTEAK